VAVVDTLRSLGVLERTLVSTMETSSLRALRAAAPELRLGISVPRARRDYLAHPATRLGAYAMLVYLRRALPHQVARALGSGLADDVMAHWGVVTPALVSATRAAGADLYVWTVDDAERLVALDRLGVTGVITNDASLFRRAGLATT
jgi:glycerophosphoryl diester phosphodiesterase